MGKKMREKDGHKREKKQVEEGSALNKQRDLLNASTGNINDVSKSINRDDNKRKRKDNNSEQKKDQLKKRKTVFDADEKESLKAPKKHKKSKDGVEVKEASVETCTAGKENTKEESSKEMDMENNFELEAKRVRKHKHKNKNRDGIDEVATETETIEQRGNVDVDDAEVGNRGQKKKKSKSVKSDKEGKHHRANVSTANQSENATPKQRSKRVSFSDQLEVFPCADVTDRNEDGKESLVYGKRYSKEEDGIIMDAVASYIESHNLGDDGISMVLNCRAHPEIKKCWDEIQAAIPWRPKDSVYRRAHVLFERDEKRQWTPEEYELIQKFVEKHGPKWKLLADTLGKHRHHVKDTWRRIKLTNRNRGNWSQEEYQNLFDCVNLDLSMKAFEEKKSKHGMLRDNICWTAISDRMETRDFVTCCKKWYDSLTSPMVAEGVWADADDYRMLDALSSLDACCMEDVEWDNLIEHRSGDLCRKRWNQMVRHIGPHADKSFAEQVEILSNRYRPDMLDARETYDSKRPVDLP